MNPEMIPELVEQLRKECYETGYAAAIEDIARFIETYRNEKVGSLNTYHAEDRILADKIRELSRGSR